MKIFTNQLGYDCLATKSAVFMAEKKIDVSEFKLIDEITGNISYQGSLKEYGEVDNWKTGYYYGIDFSEFKNCGKFFLNIKYEDKEINSYPFEISNDAFNRRTLSAVGYYFKAQRATGEWLEADKDLKFSGNKEGSVDVRGGWFDASGDHSVLLSHLSHTKYFNPQQAALSALTFFRVHDLLEQYGNEQYSMIKRRILDEGTYGAEFLYRRITPSYSFYRATGRVDSFDSVSESRRIKHEYKDFSTQFTDDKLIIDDLIVDKSYECSLRSGAGMAIATLAAAARHYYPSEYSSKDYITAAKKCYGNLEKNNKLYTNDGEWNLIDEYCALEALTEIYKTTSEYDYLRKARAMGKRILDKAVFLSEGKAYLTIEKGSTRPFFHASDPGLPVVALLNYLSIEPDNDIKKEIIRVCSSLMNFELSITNEVSNPFGYARQFIQDADGNQRNCFFFPHKTEASPWWQGENSRIASLSTAARYLASFSDEEFSKELNRYADDQINWILGLNPFDSCMMEGFGRNNIQYFFEGRYDFQNCPGGICNGITSKIDDENSISFVCDPTEEINDNWRWAEQWIPHSSWYMYAIAMKNICKKMVL